MLQLISSDDFLQLEEICLQLRKTFAIVFSSHYCSLIVEALKTNNQKRLDGFADLQKKFFDGDFRKYTDGQIQKKLYDLYFGAGFDDEVALILGFNRLHSSTLNARRWHEQNNKTLSQGQIAEIIDYLEVLDKDKRELKKVSFAALFDKERNKVVGFCIYHLFIKDGQPILHIRQAAMLEQNRGHAKSIACYLADRYPTAVYEANQRLGNLVPMKDNLVSMKLLNETAAVLGYSDKYKGLRGSDTLLKTLIDYYFKQHKEQGLGLKKWGQYWEAESIPRSFHTEYSLFKKQLLKEADYLDELGPRSDCPLPSF